MASKIQGLDRLKKKLNALPAETKKELRAAMAAGGDEVTAMQKSLAPVKSGDLKNSIGYTFGKYKAANSNVRGVSAGGSGSDLSMTIHAGDEKAWYAALVEFGTSPHTILGKRTSWTGARNAMGANGEFGSKVEHPGSAAHPFFYPAWRALRKRVKGRLSRATNKAAKKVAAGG